MKSLKQKFIENIRPKLAKELNLKNLHQVPTVEKIVVNIGIGRVKENPKILEIIKKDLAAITGQSPVEKSAKKAISAFKIKQGDIVGIMLTLRGNKMYDFLDRLINIVLPRSRDFKGLDTKSFDEFGNYSLGLAEQIIFPEIKYEDIEKIYSLEISLRIKNSDKIKSQKLFCELGFPFKNNPKGVK